MKNILIAVCLLTGLCSTLSASVICPTTPNTNSDCAFIITIAPNGTITGAAVSGANPYDGSDDALVGIINNSVSAFSGNIVLTGSTDIFGFDGDGICTFTSTNSVSLSYCSASQTAGIDPGDYQGPLNTFSNINASASAGTVVVTGLAAGGTTFFSLEGSPSSINGGGGIVVTGGAPEPATMSMIAGGLIGLYAFHAKRRRRS